jgi:hypothetical protein
MLEIQAINEAERREIAQLLGYEKLTETGGATKLDELLEKDYPEFDFETGEVKDFELEEKEGKKKVGSLKEGLDKFKERMEKFNTKSKRVLTKLGLNKLLFAYKTPYEKLMFERMSKMMQRGPGIAFSEVDRFLKQKAGVPGA